jgi:hypothetical protein
MPGVRPAVTTSRSVAGKTTRKAGHRSADGERLTLLIAILASVAAVGASILILNHGVFTYTFDDAYIHLVLARSLTIGHYGFNLSEFSSPASSILFPVLLVPFVRAGAGSAAPLLINTVALLATAYRLHRWAPFDGLAARPAVLAAAAVCSAVVSVPYLQNLALTPRAAHNIFSQQAQMGRAVERLGAGSVAVNDIGLVGWMNPKVYVVGLVGLTSSGAQEYRRAGMNDSAWLDIQATRHGADLVMLYPAWFARVPATWVKVAELRLSRRPITTGSDLVAFYVRDEPRAASTASALRVFARELPEDAALSVFCRHCF